MDPKQEKTTQKKKEREKENAEEKKRGEEQEREVARSGTFPRHFWFFVLGAVLVLIIVLAWTFLI